MIVVGLVNNMPDAALEATERQWRDLFDEAAGGEEIQFRGYALAGVARGERGRALVASRYLPGSAIADDPPDALIVTGAEPRAERLEDEPFWPAFRALVDTAVAHRLPTVWSCLAAHAAVLHLDGMRRRPLAGKLSGVFEAEAVAPDPLLSRAPRRLFWPHSRLNDLAEADIVRCGYRVLSRSKAAGVDAFLSGPSPRFLFLQGHPEYGGDTLLREYARDMGRFLRGERARPPEAPRGCLDPRAERAIAALTREALRRKTPDLLPMIHVALSVAPAARPWRTTAVALFGAWLSEISERRAAGEARWRRARA